MLWAWWLYDCDRRWTLLHFEPAPPYDDAYSSLSMWSMDTELQSRFARQEYPNARAILRAKWDEASRSYVQGPVTIIDSPCPIGPP